MEAISESRSLSRRDSAYLSVATYMASLSKARRKHGAVIVKGGSVISTGYNKDKNHPNNVSEEHIKKHCSIHAEVDAIKKTNNTKGATIYVARVNSQGEQLISKPCNNCYKKIKQSGIKKIIYTI
jgi:deoxycytidylate deaminase